jgi:hypothetical protein
MRPTSNVEGKAVFSTFARRLQLFLAVHVMARINVLINAMH